MTDILPFMVAMLLLGDLNTDAVLATRRPRAEILRVQQDIHDRVVAGGYRVLVSSSTS